MRERFASRYALLLARSLRESAETRVRAAESATVARGLRVRLARRLLADREELVAVLESQGDPRIGLAARERIRRMTRVALLLVVLFVLSLAFLVLALAGSGVTSRWTAAADTAMIAAAAAACVAYALALTTPRPSTTREQRSGRDRRTSATFGGSDRRTHPDRRGTSTSQW